MFTGIIESTGEISNLQSTGGDWRLTISSSDLDFSDVKPGDSIAVSGVCLTAIEITQNSFVADVSRETLECTSMGELKKGTKVNLEKAMTPSSGLGGHIVSGHVDGIGVLQSKKSDGRSERLVFAVPQNLSRYIASKGSVCIDGISLTVNEVNDNNFGVNIIPHTAQRTTLHLYQAGRKVNIEVDVISRYLERLLQRGESDKIESAGLESGSAVSLEKLAKAGFTK